MSSQYTYAYNPKPETYPQKESLIQALKESSGGTRTLKGALGRPLNPKPDPKEPSAEPPEKVSRLIYQLLLAVDHVASCGLAHQDLV